MDQLNYTNEEDKLIQLLDTYNCVGILNCVSKSLTEDGNKECKFGLVFQSLEDHCHYALLPFWYPTKECDYNTYIHDLVSSLKKESRNRIFNYAEVYNIESEFQNNEFIRKLREIYELENGRTFLSGE